MRGDDDDDDDDDEESAEKVNRKIERASEGVREVGEGLICRRRKCNREEGGGG